MSTTTAIAPKEKFMHLAEAAKSASAMPLDTRSNAFDQLENFELPTTRDEEWKYTRTTKLASEQWKWSNVKSITSIDTYLIPELDAHTFVFINGFLCEERSSKAIEHVTIKINQNALDAASQNAPTNFFEAFQQSTCSSALALHISKNATVEKAIHIIHIINDEFAVSTPSIAIHLEKNASVDITESFYGETKGLTIRRLFAHISENARLEYNKIQNEGDNHYLINVEDVHIDNNGFSNKNTLTLDGGWVRNDLRISLDGTNIESHLSGFYLPRRKQHIDNHTKVDHRLPHCVSNELYKGILFDNSTGVFNGKVYVWPDAQKTNAYQNNANIIAGDQAVMNTKPELEIYADDVKCSHGTTTGQLDNQAMFYLRARGMSPDSARRLLTNAFINDVLEKVANETVRTFVMNTLISKGLLTQ